jgi:hypothetical protein
LVFVQLRIAYCLDAAMGIIGRASYWNSWTRSFSGKLLVLLSQESMGLDHSH